MANSLKFRHKVTCPLCSTKLGFLTVETSDYNKGRFHKVGWIVVCNLCARTVRDKDGGYVLEVDSTLIYKKRQKQHDIDSQMASFMAEKAQNE